MAEYCEDCGCRKVSGYCTNCQEEAYIAYEQAPEMEFSPEFMEKANEQLKLVRINSRLHAKLFYFGDNDGEK